jgi:hypothetical protein
VASKCSSTSASFPGGFPFSFGRILIVILFSLPCAQSRSRCDPRWKYKKRAVEKSARLAAARARCPEIRSAVIGLRDSSGRDLSLEASMCGQLMASKTALVDSRKAIGRRDRIARTVPRRPPQDPDPRRASENPHPHIPKSAPGRVNCYLPTKIPPILVRVLLTLR